MQTWWVLDGKFLANESKIESLSEGHSIKHSGGIFETMLGVQAGVPLWKLHIERFFSSLQALKLQTPTYWDSGYFRKIAIELLAKNGHYPYARVKLVAGYLPGHSTSMQVASYLIESHAFDVTTLEKEQKGIDLAVYELEQKELDNPKNFKFLRRSIYQKAAALAATLELDDMLILNSERRICDSTISNLFCIKEGTLYTPSLDEGPVAGVFRRLLIDQFKTTRSPVREIAMDPSFVLGADEVFLTNALRGIRPVKTFCGASYSIQQGQALAKRFSHFLHGESNISEGGLLAT